MKIVMELREEYQEGRFIKIEAGLYEIGHRENTFVLIMN
jgi:hypothetical protein